MVCPEQALPFLKSTCSAGEVRRVEPSVAAVDPSSSDPAADAVVSE